MQRIFMRTQNIMALSIAAAGVFAGDSFAQTVMSTNGLLTDARGRTLYHFTQDAPNTSRCNGPCLLAWPAFTATRGARPTGPFGIIDRVNGDRQWTHKGRPLYFFSGDAHPGDAFGDQLNEQWFVVKVETPDVVYMPSSLAPAREAGY